MNNIEQLDILYKLKKEVEKSDHTHFVQTINQIIKKVYLAHYTMTFVGHFSAGKSTIINNLIGQNILPSSPVPTTSNTALVTVSDTPGITANIEGQQYTELSSYDDVKQMNKENYNVESIDIRFQSDDYQNGFTFQDTPGVDSNVKSHSHSTERFLYTSNMVFYTVDYNHVQSALNFQFMKQLNQAGIPVSFVINQIDKHNDAELSFDAFKARVTKSLSDWDITLEKIFYVTKFEHPENQFAALKTYMHEQDADREPLADYVSRMVAFIQKHQSDYLTQQMASCLETLNIEAADFDAAYDHHIQEQSVHNEAQLISNTDALSQHLEKQRKAIIDNAYIMTHDMREHIRYYLESMTKDFSLGGLFNKRKKIEQAREERLATLMSALQTQVTQEIVKPMQADMAFLTRFIDNAALNERILNQAYTIPASLITDLYQTQVQISNQYVLTFSEALMKQIGQYILKEAKPLDEEIIAHAHVELASSSSNETTDTYERYHTLRKLKTSLDTANYQHYYIHLDDSLDKLIDRTKITYTPSQIVSQVSDALIEQPAITDKKQASQRNRIEQALATLSKLSLYDAQVNNMQDTLQRVDNQVIKIGVFGTFSAGKSSLINALLGDQYLVSSPNPTTAATTEISYGHQNTVTFKTRDILLDELNDVVETVDYHFESIDDFLTQDLQDLKGRIDKNKLAFIEAIEKNYALYESLTKDSYELDIPQHELKKWSAEDEYATFVKTVHLQLEHEWLKDKIIVDSLGLYSNNQRHTNETEKILATADLILYVSYFNHAFTDNDKAFIEHMKEMNQLIENQTFKMVINAVDLAETPEDLADVHTYTKDALAEVGMQCEIFDVSSREALRGGDEGITQLREAIQTFSDIESKQVLEKQILHQLDAITQSLEIMLTDVEHNASQIKQNNEYLQRYDKIRVFPKQLIESVNQQYRNERDDQIYYLNERLNIQLLDIVKSAFNTQMTASDDFKSAKRHTSKNYLDQIHQKLYLEQTLLVNRLKQYFEKQFAHQLAPIITDIGQRHIILQADTQLTAETLETPYLHLDLSSFIAHLPKQLTKRNILQPKQQQQVQTMIKDITVEQLQPCLKQLNSALEDYLTLLNEQAISILDALEQTAQQEIAKMLSFDMDQTQVAILKATLPELKQILN
ncbi:dynamin family protein [Staphylococcus americanisciuri]|uniref:Dynamin family protein n=1 Tax=Staphylococcus americanisciuri TaxID=2973940 RepID=A0ABT2EYX2_9STAP|nr:dynamin family protein [Staphylococcus americanisciuri]MCS4485435.1 dynamin family protein [Staphylococcus americanisciuri]